MPSESAPPIYSQDDPEELLQYHNADTSVLSDEPQILIIPTTDAINFQKGFVGAEDERAAIEGELQIKGAVLGLWDQLTILFRTTERTYGQEIELSATNMVLFSASETAVTELPSSLPFAIPLTRDAPQCVHTPHSTLSHTLTATLRSSDPDVQPVAKTVTVHTRRYTAHSYTLGVAPQTYTLNDPTRIEVEVPRTAFKAGEYIPIYVKVPPPRRELVVDEGLRLRNIKVELIRVVNVKEEGDELGPSVHIPHVKTATDSSFGEGTSSAALLVDAEKADQAPVDMMPTSHSGPSYQTVVSHSGASCRFHSSLPVQLRFILRHPAASASLSNGQPNLPDGEHSYVDADDQCASITQTSLLHSISFSIKVNVSFVDMANRTERFSTISVPLNIVPPPAPLPEVEEWIDAAYQKKHDRPPAKTVRLDDVDFSAPHYHEGEAGPSALGSGAPPPFEERDAPPPFFSEAAEASTSSRHAPPPFFLHASQASASSRLPTFLESETQIFVPSEEENRASHSSATQNNIPGEGTWFGFSPTEQFDGHSQDMQRSSTPPPTLEMAAMDTNVTILAGLNEPQRTLAALGIAMEQAEDTGGGANPPPPPPMDDPSDPPPSIDSHFRSPNPQPRRSPSPQTTLPRPAYDTTSDQNPPIIPNGPNDNTSHSHAPPPYLVPDNNQEEHIARPPPYMG